MKKFWLLILFSLVSFQALATQITVYYDYGGPTDQPGDTVSAQNLDGNLNNIRNVVNGSLDNTNADVNNGFRFIEILGSLPVAGTDGRTIFDTTEDTLCFDTGTSFVCSLVLDNTTFDNGAMAYYNGSAWTDNAAGSLNQILTFGTSSVPTWSSNVSVTRTDVTTSTVSGNAHVSGNFEVDGNISWDSQNQGDIYYDNGTESLTRLTPGTSTQVLSTQGAAANPQWIDQGLKLVSTTTISTAANSGDITIEENKRYLVHFEMSALSGDQDILVRVNSLSAANYVDQSTTSQTSIQLTPTNPVGSSTVKFFSQFDINTHDYFIIHGRTSYFDNGGTFQGDTPYGMYNAAITEASFEILSSANMTGTVYLYEYDH